MLFYPWLNLLNFGRFSTLFQKLFNILSLCSKVNMMKKQHIKLSVEDNKKLTELLSKGSTKVRVQKRALALKKLDSGLTYKTVSDLLEVSYPTILKWAKKYRTNGLEFLQDKPRSGRPINYDGEAAAKVTAMACSTPPEGYARWSLRLLADKIIELEILPEISYSQVGRFLKKTNFNLIEKDNGALES